MHLLRKLLLALKLKRRELDDPVDIAAGINNAVSDARIMLRYAADSGVQLTPEIVLPLLTVILDHSIRDRESLAAFYQAYANLSKILTPVSAATIKACEAPNTRRNLVYNRAWAILLTVIIAGASVIVFVDNSISQKISNDISANNDIAIKLHQSIDSNKTNTPANTRVNTPNNVNTSTNAKNDISVVCTAISTPDPGNEIQSDNLTLLQTFASNLREINHMYRELDHMNTLVGRIIVRFMGIFISVDEKGHLATSPTDNLNKADNPNKALTDTTSPEFQLNPSVVNYKAEIICKTAVYERVRDYANSVLLNNSLVLGALGAYLLPILYAFLGAYAYRLRTFADTIRRRTYHPSFADSARLIAAVIAGAIISLFNKYTEGILLSPLAIAFLIGYGVEIFFAFLDTLLASFGRSQTRPESGDPRSVN